MKHVRPTADGEVTITVMPGANNTHPNQFYYINAMTIKAHK